MSGSETMFFFKPGLLSLLVIGLVFILLPIILTLLRKLTPLCGIANIIVGLIIGGMAIHSFYSMSINRPDRSMMRKSKNLVALLEQGRISEGRVLEQFYDKWQPQGWRILYSFESPNPEDGRLEIHYGSAKGRKYYYTDLSKGDTVTIIYDPNKPKVNAEVFEIIDDRHYRSALKRIGNEELLDSFIDKYGLRDCSFQTWYKYRRQREK
jgi:hypothetical protein